VDADEHLVVLRHRPLDIVDAQHVRRAVPIVDDCPHEAEGLPVSII
jgi:hypothetical protein